jgi:hypothetical protein
LSVSATGGAFGEHLGLFVCLAWSKMSRSLPRLSPSGDVAGAPGDPVQDPADAVLVESAGTLKVEREKTGVNRSCKAAGWLCTVVVSNLNQPLSLHGKGIGLNSRP